MGEHIKNFFKNIFRFLLVIIVLAFILVLILSPESLPIDEVKNYFAKEEFETIITNTTIKNSQEAIKTIKANVPEVVNINEKKTPLNGTYTDFVINENLNGWRVLFYEGTKDCFQGCANAHYWYFNISNEGVITKVGEYSSIYNTQTNGFDTEGVLLDFFLQTCPVIAEIDCSKDKISNTGWKCQKPYLKWIKLSCVNIAIKE